MPEAIYDETIEAINGHLFVDAQKMNRNFPGDFFAHSMQELHLLKVGDIVKVAIVDPGTLAERIWVKLTEVSPFQLKGNVDSYCRLKDQEVVFAHRHVWQVWQHD